VSATTPAGELDPRFSSEGAAPTAWEDARRELETAEVYWVASVRPEGRPHVTPIAAIWLDGALHFVTGENEPKARNLARNPHCVVTTGHNVFDGLDAVLEGEAVRLSDTPALQRLADAHATKYDRRFRFRVRDGALYHEDGPADKVLAYRVHAAKGLGFAKGAVFSHTRWRFSST
jgi:pyridoxamine 5'-phosphate oxidase-like protein